MRASLVGLLLLALHTVAAQSAELARGDVVLRAGTAAEVRDDGRLVLENPGEGPLIGLPYGAALPESKTCTVGEQAMPCSVLTLAVMRAAFIGKYLRVEATGMTRNRGAFKTAAIDDLVRAGWLLPDAENPARGYKELAQEARTARRGIWSFVRE